MATLDRLALALEKRVISVYHQTFSGSLQIYDNRTSSFILNAALSGRPSVDIHSDCLTIDLVRMKEVNLRNGREDDVVIEISWDLKALVSRFFASTKTVRHQILSLLVDKLRHESYVEKFVKEKAGCRQFISYRSNPFISTHHSLYTRFLESFENAIERNREGFGRLFEKFRYHQYIDSKFNQDRDIVNLCFHGTNLEWMDSIMQNGMDPTLRRSDSSSDWFATDALISIPFTVNKTSRELVSRDGIKLLVFLVIKEVSSTMRFVDHNMISIHSSQNQLPIGQVTLR